MKVNVSSNKMSKKGITACGDTEGVMLISEDGLRIVAGGVHKV